jgi:HD superfamily phosphohydrolase
MSGGRGGDTVTGAAGGNFRRKVERAAELRALRSSGGTAEDDAELSAAESELREKRRKVTDAARADYLIRDAMAQGKFDNLEYSGKPIPGLGEGYDPDWWVKGLIQREHLSGLGPKAILLRTEDAELDAKLDAQYTDKQVRDIVEDFNASVIEARRQLQGGPPVVTKTRDADAEVQRWRERCAAAAAAAPEPVAEAKPPWWRRLRDRSS